MGQNQSFNFDLQLVTTKPYSQVKIEKLIGCKQNLNASLMTREALVGFTSSTLNEWLQTQLNNEASREFYIEDVPFHTGKELFYFKGFTVDPFSNKIEDKVFKVSKFKEINVENMFLGQNIAAFLANEFCKFYKI